MFHKRSLYTFYVSYLKLSFMYWYIWFYWYLQTDMIDTSVPTPSVGMM